MSNSASTEVFIIGFGQLGDAMRILEVLVIYVAIFWLVASLVEIIVQFLKNISGTYLKLAIFKRVFPPEALAEIKNECSLNFRRSWLAHPEFLIIEQPKYQLCKSYFEIIYSKLTKGLAILVATIIVLCLRLDLFDLHNRLKPAYIMGINDSKQQQLFSYTMEKTQPLLAQDIKQKFQQQKLDLPTGALIEKFQDNHWQVEEFKNKREYAIVQNDRKVTVYRIVSVYQKKLDARLIPMDNDFQKISLSKQAKIEVKEAGRKWIIRDTVHSKQYLLVKNNRVINVYDLEIGVRGNIDLLHTNFLGLLLSIILISFGSNYWHDFLKKSESKVKQVIDHAIAN